MSSEDRVREALDLISYSGGVDGGHHKAWVLDQVVRVLTGCPSVEKTATDYQGKPYTYVGFGESEEYLQWLKEYRSGEDGPETYEWDEGIPP